MKHLRIMGIALALASALIVPVTFGSGSETTFTMERISMTASTTPQDFAAMSESDQGKNDIYTCSTSFGSSEARSSIRCSFVCEFNFLTVEATMVDTNGEVAIGGECATTDPNNPEEENDWEASCSGFGGCNGHGETVAAETGRCVADEDEWWNNGGTGTCTNHDGTAAIILMQVLEDGTGVPPPVLAELRDIPACVGPAALQECIKGWILADHRVGNTLIMTIRESVLSAALCSDGACHAI